jgi:hypothetical protein
MDTLYVAFRRCDPRSIVDRLISWFDRGPFVHAELQLDGWQAFAAHAWTGCEFHRPDYPLGRWAILPVQCNQHDAELACEALKGSHYDYLGVMRFAFPLFHPTSGRWFCSELVARVIDLAGGPQFSRDYRIGPNELYRRLKEHHEKHVAGSVSRPAN